MKSGIRENLRLEIIIWIIFEIKCCVTLRIDLSFDAFQCWSISWFIDLISSILKNNRRRSDRRMKLWRNTFSITGRREWGWTRSFVFITFASLKEKRRNNTVTMSFLLTTYQSVDEFQRRFNLIWNVFYQVWYNRR